MKYVKKIGLILLGNLLYAASIAYFVLPSGLIMGGGTGLALFFNHLINVPIALFVAILNILLFVLGAIMLGKKFALTTVLSTICYPIELAFMEWMEGKTGPITSDPMLSTIFGGLLIGAAFGLVFRAGASTGGMDIPPLIINKKTGISLSLLLYGFDVITLILQMTFASGDQILYGILLVCIYSVTLEYMFAVGKRQIEIKIVSKKYTEISNAIHNRLDRGTTLVSISGGYTDEYTTAVTAVINNRQLFAATEMIDQIDPDAFIVISKCTEVRGRGFSDEKVYAAHDDHNT